MKGLRTICSECGTATVFQEVTIDFERKGVKAAVSGVPAMVCPKCGERYVPGEIAGDVVDTVSRTIDGMGDLMKKSYHIEVETSPGERHGFSQITLIPA